MNKEAVILVVLFCLATPAFAGETGLGSPVLPHRVYDMRTGELTDLESLLGICADADVVTLGENHGDPATHRMELAILEGLNRMTDGDIILSMEMFEKDIQGVVDDYINRDIDEDEFLTNAHPPSTYERDYRRLITYCRRYRLPVIASNFPWRLSTKVGRMGYDAAVSLFSEEDRELLPEIYDAPDDAYKVKHKQIIMAIGGHGGGMGMTEELTETYYQSQVLHDETMAESVYKTSIGNPGHVVFHIVGSFHLWNYLGTYARIQKRMPAADIVSILAVPVEDLLAPPPDDIPGCDYAIMVLGDQVEMP